MTGESLPVDKSPGDDVFCGTINRFGSIDITSEKVGGDSSLQKLIHMMQEAEKKQAPMQRIADRGGKLAGAGRAHDCSRGPTLGRAIL